MAAKIITFLLIGGANLAVCVILFFFLMLGLNGFSERDAIYAFVFFIIGALLVTILSGILGILLLRLLIKKKLSSILASIISVLVFSTLGAVINFALVFGGVIIADLVRTSR